MIGFWPDPYPDELFYSNCSRYHDQLKYRSRESTDRDLFGRVRANVAIDFPSNLAHLIAVMPPRHRYTAERFINDHTLLPYYGPFLPPERLARMREDMCGMGGGAIHGSSGILTSPIRMKFLRYCPLCVEADRKKWGETYWHRLHQVPGVEVCPLHNVFLEDSDILTRHRRSSENYVGSRVVELTITDVV